MFETITVGDEVIETYSFKRLDNRGYDLERRKTKVISVTPQRFRTEAGCYLKKNGRSYPKTQQFRCEPIK